MRKPSKRYAFIGEKRSDRAITMGVTWKDGRLAAKQLFDALKASGIDPNNQAFMNWFEESVPQHTATAFAASGYILVALGQRVSKAMERLGIDHLKLIHPAARGKIRRKDRYGDHVKNVLKGIQ